LLYRTLLAAVAFALASLLVGTAFPAENERFEFSGVQRSRFETIDEQFGGGLSGEDHVLALQTSLFFDYKLEKLQLFAEIMDSRGELNDEFSSVGTFLVDTLEPIQTYVAWTFKDAVQPGSESTLRVGRLTLNVGARRIVSRNRFRNTVSTFTGVDWQWKDADGRNARVVYLVPMRILPTDTQSLVDDDFELDRGLRDSALWGGYYQFPKGPHSDVVEVYAFDYDAQGTPTDPTTAFDIVSVGARVFRAPARAHWNYEVEVILQAGEAGGIVAGLPRRDLDHRAHMLHFEVGYQFDVSWAPNLIFQYDDASGDHSPLDDGTERFNTLFGDRRFEFGPTGIYGPFNRSNLQSQALRLTFTPGKRWQSMVHYSSFRLAQERDAWVGIGARDPTGRAGGSLGRQLEVSATWTAIPNRLTLEGGLAHLNFGRFADQTGVSVGGDPIYYYVTATTRF
jgi:hypothetical protein